MIQKQNQSQNEKTIQKISKLILSQQSIHPQLKKLQLQASNGQQSSQDILIKAIIKILKSQLRQIQNGNGYNQLKKEQEIIFKKINQFVISAQPKFIHKINNIIFKQINDNNKLIKIRQSQILENFILLWTRIFNGSQQKIDYPNVHKTFFKLIKQNNIRQNKQLPIGYKNYIWTFQKVLAQRNSKKVQFFDDVDEQFSYISDDQQSSIVNQIIYMDAAEIKQMRSQIEKGKISKQTGQQFLLKAKNFLDIQKNQSNMIKKKQYKQGSISIIFDYNEEHKWAQQFIKNYQNYVDPNLKPQDQVKFILQYENTNQKKNVKNNVINKHSKNTISQNINQDFYENDDGDFNDSDVHNKINPPVVQRDTFYSQKNKNPFSKISQMNSGVKGSQSKGEISQNLNGYNQQNNSKTPSPNQKSNFLMNSNKNSATSPNFKESFMANINQNINSKNQKQIEGNTNVKHIHQQRQEIKINQNDQQMIHSFHNLTGTMNRKTKDGFSSTPKKNININEEVKRKLGTEGSPNNNNNPDDKFSYEDSQKNKKVTPIFVKQYSFDPFQSLKHNPIQTHSEKQKQKVNFVLGNYNHLKQRQKDKINENNNYQQQSQQQIVIKRQSATSSPKQKIYNNKIAGNDYSQNKYQKNYKNQYNKNKGKNQKNYEHFDDSMSNFDNNSNPGSNNENSKHQNYSRQQSHQHLDDLQIKVIKHKPNQNNQNKDFSKNKNSHNQSSSSSHHLSTPQNINIINGNSNLDWQTPIKMLNQNTKKLQENHYYNQSSQQFSKSRDFRNTSSPGKYGGSHSKKLSQFSQQKKTRKQFAPVHQISQVQEYIAKPYFSHFSDLQNLARFRRNCFEQNLTLYSSSTLLVLCTLRQQSSNGIRVQILYRNQSNHNVNVCSIYKIPRCFQIEKKSKIHKKFVLTQRSIIHNFNLKLLSFPLQPCLLALSYSYNYQTSIQIPVPITIKNFVEGVLITQQEWIGLWQEFNATFENPSYNNSGRLKLSKNIIIDRSIIDIDQLSNHLRQCIQLGSIQGYSVKQFGAMYQYPSLNDQFYEQQQHLNFLMRFSVRVDNIVSLQLLPMRKVSKTQTDFLDYYINNLIMLFMKIQV